MRLKTVPTILAAWLALTFLAAGPLAAAPALKTQESPEARVWRQAEIHLAQGQGPKAYPLFVGLLEKFPGHNALLRGLARAAALSGRRDESLGLYAQLLAKFPHDPQLTAEARAVHGGSPAAVPAAETGLQVSGRVRLGFNYDTNANQGPASEDMELGSWQVNIPGSKRVKTFAEYFGANIDWLKPLEAENWALVGDAGLMLRWSHNRDLAEIDSREWQFLRLAAGLRRAGGRDLFDLRLKAEIFDYDFTSSVVAVGPEALWIHAFTPAWQLGVNLGAERRAYQRDSGRNGLYGQEGLNLRFFFGDQGRHNLALGGGFLWGRPESSAYRYLGWTAPVRLSFNLTDRLNLSPHVSYTQEFYDEPATVLEEVDRRDDRLRAGLDLGYRLTESLSLEFNYTYTDNESKSALYTYDQHLVGLGLAWSF